MDIDFCLYDQNQHLRFYLSKHVRHKREDCGFSVADMSSILQISPDSYRKFEAGAKKMTAPQLRQIVETLSLQQDDLNELARIARISQVNSYAQEFYKNLL